jgi:hypothetical protein
LHDNDGRTARSFYAQVPDDHSAVPSTSEEQPSE